MRPGTTKLELALGYAARGWPVFPCQPRGKRPITSSGFKAASTDPKQIKAWWQDSPKANIGIATGPAGLVVVDVDVKDGAQGGESWAALLEELGPGIADTAIAKTPSGGRHYFYQAGAHGLRNSAGKLGPGIDVRGDGGYVVAPGSETAAGTYAWVEDREPVEVPLVLVNRLGTSSRKRAQVLHQPAIPVGQRNATLTSLAGTMRRRGMSAEGIRAALQAENRRCQPPLPEWEVDGIATSVAAYEPARPTADPGEERDRLVHEAAHAEVLRSEWRDTYRWSVHEGTWRRWTGRVWEKIDESVAVADAQKTLRRHYARALADRQSQQEDERLRSLHRACCRYSSVRDGLAFLKGEPGFHTKHEKWDADLDQLNCADGLLDLKTQTLRKHDPSALCTMITRWGYADEHSNGAWQKQLELGLPNADIRRQVQRDLGRALSGSVKEHSLPIWYGTGRNTKTTDAEALLIGLGEYAMMGVDNLLMASKNERHPTEIAELSGKRLVFSDEIDAGKELAEARVKDLTGGGGVKRAHFMHKDNFDVKKTFTIFLLVNHRPTIHGTDKGIWDRVREVPWTVSIPFEMQRPQDEVVAELVADGAWMLRWMVAGYADFLADPRWMAEEVRVATEAYHVEQDRLFGFIAEACELKPTASEDKASLLSAYEFWCEMNDEQALGKTEFAAALKARGIRSRRVGHENVPTWLGIRLRAGEKP